MEAAKTVEEQRAERKAAREKARAEQREADLAAINVYEIENDCELAVIDVSNFAAGMPAAVVAVRVPTEMEYKRWHQSVNRAGNADAKIAAQQQLANACWVYPPLDQRGPVLQGNPGLLSTIGNKAIRLSSLREDEEGKG